MQVNKPIDSEFLHEMANGVPILDTMTRPCKVKKEGEYIFNIVLTQGLNRQIRRMCEYFGYEVVKFKRIRIINIHLDIPVGQWRELTSDELETLNSFLEDSVKTVE